MHPVPPSSALPPSPSPSLSCLPLPSPRPLPFRSPKQTLLISPLSPTTPGTPTWPTSRNSSRSSIERRGPVTPCIPGFRFICEDGQEDENREEGKRNRDSAGSESMNGSGKSTTRPIRPLQNGCILAKSRSCRPLTLSSLSPPPPSSPATSASTSVPVALMIPTHEASTSTTSTTFAPSPICLRHLEKPLPYTSSTDSMSSSSLPFAPVSLETASVECVTMRDKRETSEGSGDASERTTTTRSASGGGRRRRKKKIKADKKIVGNGNGSGQMTRIWNKDSFISLVDEDDIDSDIENVVGCGATATNAASTPRSMYLCSSGTENEKKESSDFTFAPYIPFVVQHERALQQQQKYQPNSKLSTPILVHSPAHPSTTSTSTSSSCRPRSRVPPPLMHPVPPSSALPPSPSPSPSRLPLPSLRPLPFCSPKQTLPLFPLSPTTPGTPTWPTSRNSSRSSIESRGPVTPCIPRFRFFCEDGQEDENREEGRRNRDSAGSESMNGSGKSTTHPIQPLRNGCILAKSRSRRPLTLSSLSPPPPSSPPPLVPLPLPPHPRSLSSTSTAVPLGLKKRPSTLNSYHHDEGSRGVLTGLNGKKVDKKGSGHDGCAWGAKEGVSTECCWWFENRTADRMW